MEDVFTYDWFSGDGVVTKTSFGCGSLLEELFE